MASLVVVVNIFYDRNVTLCVDDAGRPSEALFMPWQTNKAGRRMMQSALRLSGRTFVENGRLIGDQKCQQLRNWMYGITKALPLPLATKAAKALGVPLVALLEPEQVITVRRIVQLYEQRGRAL